MSEAQLSQRYLELEQIAMSLAQEEQRLRMLLEAAIRSVDALRAIKDGKSDRSVIPLSHDVMVKAQVSDKDPVLVRIGAGLVIEKSADSAILYVESKIKELSVAINDVMVKRQRTLAELESTNEMLGRMAQKPKAAS